MRISRRSIGGLTVLDLIGCLTAGPDERELVSLRAAVRDLVDMGCIHVVVNLAEIRSIDARGLGELATAMKTVSKAGGRLAVMSASPRIARMLAVTRLDTIFERCEAEVESFA
jgi:anti-sigma B factor antagonist